MLLKTACTQPLRPGWWQVACPTDPATSPRPSPRGLRPETLCSLQDLHLPYTTGSSWRQGHTLILNHPFCTLPKPREKLWSLRMSQSSKPAGTDWPRPGSLLALSWTAARSPRGPLLEGFAPRCRWLKESSSGSRVPESGAGADSPTPAPPGPSCPLALGACSCPFPPVPLPCSDTGDPWPSFPSPVLPAREDHPPLPTAPVCWTPLGPPAHPPAQPGPLLSSPV